jgi:arylformamidase
VPDYADYFARWASTSAELRGALKCAIDVRYGARPKETLDLFHAADARGLLFFIHGGYWRSLDKSDHSFVAKAYVENGYDVAVINYDLCPTVDIGTIVDECRAALRYVLREGGRLGLATGKVVVSGHSAGGHLAAMLHATDLQALGIDPSAIRGAVALSGVFDLTPLLYASMNADLKLDRAMADAWSPVRLQPVLDAPLLIAAGADETSEFIRQSQLMWDAWPSVRPAGSTGPVFMPGVHHFSAVERFADAGDPLFRQTLALFG